MDCSLPGFSCPWNFPGKTVGVGCRFLLQGIILTQGLNLCLLSLSMEFSRQDCRSGLLFPTPGDNPDPGIESVSLESPALASGFFTTGSSSIG